MAGLEVVVRPVVFPDIRPQSARSLPPEDDPEQGICEIKGANSFVVQFSSSNNWSATYEKSREDKRRVDVARVYQKEDDGTVNKDNFVDIEVANKIWMKGGKGKTAPEPDDAIGNVSINPLIQAARDEMKIWNLKPIKQEDNIEIKQRDKMIKNESEKK